GAAIEKRETDGRGGDWTEEEERRE
ncbi:hypothetical protein TNCV_373461, partial [Trichonephila clavipes]